MMKKCVSLLLGSCLSWILLLVPSVSFGEPAGQDDVIDQPVETFVDEGQKSEEEMWDPFEPVNRGVFWFNDTLDIYLFEPIARGYNEITPTEVQTGITNFFDNLLYPMYLVSDLVQLKFSQAGDHTGRFAINSTVGLLGFIDVAKDWGLEPHREDFGVSLGYYGVPPGPYIVLPILGPSNVRDVFGTVVDSFLDPTTAIGYSSLSSATKTAAIGTTNAVRFVNRRSALIEPIETAKESSVDYYLFVQAAYHQMREGLIHDRAQVIATDTERMLDEDVEDFGEE
jgi:phospholipid-binding lipoprotein MlaA